MLKSFQELEGIFLRTKDALGIFMGILEPTIENAKDEHERLYFHHIYEEEEHRLDRLNVLLPKLNYFIENVEEASTNNYKFIQLLQDISLEKFGLHNFLEHLDLALFQFKGSAHEENLQNSRNITHEDYQSIKSILGKLNEAFDGAADSTASTPTDEKEGVSEHLKIEGYSTNSNKNDNKNVEHVSQNFKKGLTVGSLKK
jgi:hypothetical protein